MSGRAWRRARLGVGLLLLTGGLALVLRPTAHALLRGWTHVQGQRAWRQACARPTEALVAGAPAAWLRVPACGVNTLVLAGGDTGTLRRAPGLLETPGATIISAHRDQHFRRLAGLRPGHRVELQDRYGVTHAYTVTDLEHLPRDVVAERVQAQRGVGWLLLVTCHPFRQIGPAPNRLLAWARPETPDV